MNSIRPSIVFAILSAAHRPDTLAQLVAALDGRPVVIHHDFSQQPNFPLPAGNVMFVTDPARSGWASWGLMESLVRTIDFCGQQHDYDYLQILTPVDLPIRPLEAFEAWVAAATHDVAVDAMPLDEDDLSFMTFAYRAFADEDSLAYRLLWQLRERYFGPGYETINRAGLSVPVDCLRNADGTPAMAARLSLALTRAWAAIAGRAGITAAAGPLHVGSTWFGASRDACEFLVERARDQHLQARFKNMFCAPEMLIATVFAGSEFRRAPANHAISAFTGPRPSWLGVGDLRALRESGKFFARKFPDDPGAEVRQQVLASLAPYSLGAPEPAAPNVVQAGFGDSIAARIPSNESGR